VAWCARQDAQPDLYFHLACARWILEHGFPRGNVFLDPALQHAFVDPEWGFQLLLLAGETLGGPRLLGLLKTLAALGLGVLVLRPLRSPTRWALWIPFVLLAGPRFVIRPELVTYLFVAWHLGWREAPRGRRLGWIAVAQVLWVNSHGFALLGPALCAARALTAGRRWRGWATAAGVLLGCCMVSPYPVGSLIYLPRVASSSLGSGRLPIAELAAPWSAGASDPTWVLLLAWTALSLPLAWIGWRTGRLSRDRAAAAACALILGFPYARNLPLAALGLVTLSGSGLGVVVRRTLSERRRAVACVLLGLLAFLLARATVDDRFHRNPQVDVAAGFGRVAFKAYPEAAAAWDRDPLPEPIFNGFSSGHYLIYRGLRPYLCGNLDLYPRSHFNAYRALLAGDPRGFGDRLVGAGFQSAFLDHREVSPLLVEALARDPGWGLRYVGPKAVAFVRGAESRPVSATPELPDEARQGSILRALTLLPARGLHPRLRLHLARVLPAVGETERALELSRGALRLAPHDPAVLAATAELERLHGDSERAWELAQRWVEREPTPEAWVNLGSLAMGRGDYTRALRAYRQALDATPDPDTALRARINLLAAGEAAEDPLAIRRALARFGAELEPALAHFYRGNAARIEADYPTALRWLEASTEADPGMQAAWARLGEVRFLSGDYSASVAAYRELVALDPDASNWRDLGVAQERAGDAEGALEAWRQASEADPREVLALVYSARQHAAASRREEALQALREALRRDPKHPLARKLLLQLRGGGG